MSGSKEMGKKQLGPLGETGLVLRELGDGAPLGRCVSQATLFVTDTLSTQMRNSW